MLTPNNKCRFGGFSLPEIMLALGIVSIIILAVVQLFSVLNKQSQQGLNAFRLEQTLSQALSVIEKDILRAGFCAGNCRREAITLSIDSVNPAQNCLTVSYDINHSGHWEPGERSEGEFFSYRLRNGALEVQTGYARCRGKRWDKFFDPNEVTITGFQVSSQQGSRGTLYLLGLSGYWTDRPHIKQQVQRWVGRRNHDAV
ncbi:prepilin peptidase-dependent protein [Lonsdalea quercina]|uniref:prepilin peptidase-dependent protein n=1 Tax=Lonsdalea quercina TaxID=71657 RepID=UPI003976C97A